MKKEEASKIIKEITGKEAEWVRMDTGEHFGLLGLRILEESYAPVINFTRSGVRYCAHILDEDCSHDERIVENLKEWFFRRTHSEDEWYEYLEKKYEG